LVGQVLSVHVDPPVTGRGVGGALLDHAVATFRAAGFREATLWVVGDNPGARRFYERAGWRPDGNTRREPLAVEGEDGEDVMLIRYRVDLD
jgi:ribosomal protein S18 acetylase RimI-like enzyme